MIYTVSLNPSIDYIVEMDNFIMNDLNRTSKDEKIPGGKGIMVSKLLKTLGIDSTNLGFIGGYTGQFIMDKLREENILENFIRIKGDTRINVKIKSLGDFKETEINAGGPNINTEEKDRLLMQIESLDEGDLLVLSGSIPTSLPSLFYLDIIEIIDRKNMEFIIDTTGENLYKSLEYGPLLIKPNKKELEDLFKEEIRTLDEVIYFGSRCLEMGSQNVIVSLGKDGAVFLSAEESYFAPPVEGKLINSVGAGDSMVGGFIYGLSKGYSKYESFKIAVASGTATAFSQDIGRRRFVEEIYDKVEIKKL